MLSFKKTSEVDADLTRSWKFADNIKKLGVVEPAKSWLQASRGEGEYIAPPAPALFLAKAKGTSLLYSLLGHDQTPTLLQASILIHVQDHVQGQMTIAANARSLHGLAAYKLQKTTGPSYRFPGAKKPGLCDFFFLHLTICISLRLTMFISKELQTIQTAKTSLRTGNRARGFTFFLPNVSLAIAKLSFWSLKMCRKMESFSEGIFTKCLFRCSEMQISA